MGAISIPDPHNSGSNAPFALCERLRSHGSHPELATSIKTVRLPVTGTGHAA